MPLTFDRFRVVQLANGAVEEVRRAEVRREPALKRSGWMWLKDKHRWPVRMSRSAPHVPDQPAWSPEP